jgi:hypothetical protein
MNAISAAVPDVHCDDEYPVGAVKLVVVTNLSAPIFADITTCTDSVFENPLTPGVVPVELTEVNELALAFREFGAVTANATTLKLC